MTRHALHGAAPDGRDNTNNHLHVLARLDPEADAAWSDEEVVRRRARLCPPKDRARRVLSCVDPGVQEKLDVRHLVNRRSCPA